jgi:hypothetical protein
MLEGGRIVGKRCFVLCTVVDKLEYARWQAPTSRKPQVGNVLTAPNTSHVSSSTYDIIFSKI